MKYFKSIFIYLFIILMLTSCIQSPKMETTPDNDKNPYEIEQLDIYNVLQLGTNKYLRILDVNHDQLLFHITESLTEDHPSFSEISFGELSEAIIIYDIGSDEIIYKKAFEEPVYCFSACFYKEGFVFMQIHQDDADIFTKYDILYSDTKNIYSVLSDDCVIGVSSIPELHRLNDVVVNSYFNPVNDEFGIRSIDSNLDVYDIIKLVDDGYTEHIRTDISENGKELIYFAAVEGTGIYYICNSTDIIGSIELGKDERIYDHCMLKDCVLLTMEVIGENENDKMYYLKDFEGNMIAEKEMLTQIYRLKSNGIDSVLGIDMRFAPYRIRWH